MRPELSITNLSILTCEAVTPKTINGYRALMDTFNAMLKDNLTQDEIEAIEAAKERAWQEGQKLSLVENAKKYDYLKDSNLNGSVNFNIIKTTGSGETFDYLFDVDSEDQAAFIVKACNNHEKLLNACKLALGAFENNWNIDWGELERAIKDTEK